MKRLILLIVLLLICLFLLESCKLFERSPQLEAQIIELDTLAFTPEQIRANKPIEIANGILLTPISRNKALLTQSVKKPGKVKYKNVGNTDIVDKSVVKDKSKVKAKDAGVIGNENEVEQSKGLPAWLLYVGLGLALLFILWPVVKKYFPLARIFL